MLDIDAICQMLDVSRATVRRWVVAGIMPEPVRLGRRTIRWRQSDIDRWLTAGCPAREILVTAGGHTDTSTTSPEI